ncbi:hypothetical protein QM480_17990 [Flectobacillus sp. DC10W]|jgi:hypothetical protein|uniref:Oligosaccharide repeat unit polymerase n=1 Tax=Flectobacillus longus TaxID=2984207 RepID=A0ABT6YRL9_9BACT|nr:hypothetical protein [Flectobacillus longus]MDI9866239.1 hypothetical protein [Flectobacillus longus]
MFENLFYILSLVGFCYYIFSKRLFDFLGLSFFSSLVYFIPGFSGLIINPYNTDETTAIYPPCYWVYDLVLGINLLTVILNDTFLQEKSICITGDFKPNLALGAFFMGMLGLIGSLIQFPDLYLNRAEISKGELQSILSQQADRWSVIWAMGASLLAMIAFKADYRFYQIVAVLLLGLDLFWGGNRSSSAFVVLALLVLSTQQEPKRLANYFIHWKYLGKVLLLIGLGTVFFISKLILPLLQANRMDLFEEIYPSWQDVLFHAFIVSEPAAIQANLSETLRKGIEVDWYHPVDIVSQLIIGGDWLGMQSSSHYLTQKDLFPQLEYGLAYNIWGDIWASGGWITLIVFIFFYHIVLVIGNLLIKRSTGYPLVVIALFFSIWAFYIHRNNLLFQLYLQKRVLVFAIVPWLFSLIKIRWNSSHTKSN